MSGVDLLALAARVEASAGADRGLDALIASAIRLEKVPDWARNWTGEWKPTELGSVVLMQDDGTPGPHFMAREYTASLDAAMTLVPDAPWSWNVTMATAYGSASVMPCDGQSTGIHDKRGGHCHGAATPALALVSAALRARHQSAAGEGENGLEA